MLSRTIQCPRADRTLLDSEPRLDTTASSRRPHPPHSTAIYEEAPIEPASFVETTFDAVQGEFARRRQFGFGVIPTNRERRSPLASSVMSVDNRSIGAPADWKRAKDIMMVLSRRLRQRNSLPSTTNPRSHPQSNLLRPTRP